MSSEDTENDKKPIEYSRIVANIPIGLLKEFDIICSLKHYSRIEAVKEAMRIFVIENTPEGYLTYDQSKEQWGAMWTGMYDSFLKIYNDPKYKQLQGQNIIQTQLAPKTKNT